MNQVAKKRFFENVSIIDIAEEGKGVGKSDDFVLFVDKAVPGDIADVMVYRSKKNFGEGKITELKQASEYRTEAFCEHFGTCGGCKWQHMTYAAQLKFKQELHGGLRLFSANDKVHLTLRSSVFASCTPLKFEELC